MKRYPDGRRGRYARGDGSHGGHGTAPRLRARALGDGPPLAAARPPSPEVEHTWSRLVMSHGGAPVETLAVEVGWSRRHLLGRFREHTGLPPKVFARILRFQKAAALMADPAGPSLCEIALD